MSNINLLTQNEMNRIQSTLFEMRDRAKEDVVYFIDQFCYTFNPKQSPFHLRFKLFPYQKRLVRDIVSAIRNGEDLFIDKTREMGVSYCILDTLLWFWLFEPASNFLIGSRKEDYVDNRRGGITGNKEESLFGKLDYTISRLPNFVLPKGFVKDRHFNFMSLVNPENGNAISGESSNQNFSRGGRQRAIFLDEFAFWSEGCYRDDTEILTESGWKLIKNVSIGEKIYSMDNNENADYMPVTDTQKIYVEKLLSFKNKSVNLHVTPNHNMLIKKRYYPNNKRKFLSVCIDKVKGVNSNGKFYFRKAKNIFEQQHDFIPLTSNWIGGEKPNKIYGFNSEDFMEFLGWFISEGHSSNKSEHRKICISQSKTANRKKCEQIEELLIRMDLPIKYWSNGYYVTAGKLPKEMFKELCALGKAYNKYIPQKYLNLHKDLLFPLFDALIKGDGWSKEYTFGKKAIGYASISKRLADNIQELAQKIGIRASIINRGKMNGFIRGKKVYGKHDIFFITFGYKQVAHLINLEKKQEKYNSYAYCVSTPFHTLFVRSNGITSWCGNSSVWGATADTTNCRIVATTPGIQPSKAKRLRFGKDGEKIKVITLNYQLDPRKDKKWLDEQRERRSTEDFNREIMVNWETSITGRVYPEIESAAYVNFPYILNQQPFFSWDFGLDGVAIILWQQNKSNSKWRVIDSYEKADQPIQFFFPFFGKPIDSKFQYDDEDIKAIKIFSQYPKGIHFGDPDVNKRSLLTGTSTRMELSKIGVYVQSQTKNDFFRRRDITKVYLQKGIEINSSARTENFFEAIKSARYPQREETSQATTPIATPIHDWCLVGETKIRTLNGWKEIKDLVGKQPWVWGYSEERKKLIPMKSSGCWLVGKNRPTILIGLDDGNSIRCTPNHPFMLRDGTYKDAEFLQKGDSLMPFYERNDGGYIDIQLNDGSHGPEHQLVYAEVKGLSDQDNHIHHIDDCKWHNSPENLEEISPMKHCSKTFIGIPHGKRSKYVPPYIPYSSRLKIYKDCRFCGKEFLTDHKHFFCSLECNKENERKQLRDRAMNDNAYRVLAKKINHNYEERHTKKCLDCGTKINRKSIRCRSCSDRTHNHKVRFVQKDYLLRDVYDLEVPIYHNFVTEGVVTHNTAHFRTSMEYFFVNIDTYVNIKVSRPSWADKAVDVVRGTVHSLTSRRSLMKRR